MGNRMKWGRGMSVIFAMFIILFLNEKEGKIIFILVSLYFISFLLFFYGKIPVSKYIYGCSFSKREINRAMKRKRHCFSKQYNDDSAMMNTSHIKMHKKFSYKLWLYPPYFWNVIGRRQHTHKNELIKYPIIICGCLLKCGMKSLFQSDLFFDSF